MSNKHHHHAEDKKEKELRELTMAERLEIKQKKQLLPFIYAMTLTNGLICFCLPYTQLPMFFNEVLGITMPQPIIIILALIAGLVTSWVTFGSAGGLLMKDFSQMFKPKKVGYGRYIAGLFVLGVTAYIVKSAMGEWVFSMNTVMPFIGNTFGFIVPWFIAVVAGLVLTAFFVDRCLEAYDIFSKKIKENYPKGKNLFERLMYILSVSLGFTAILAAATTGIVFYHQLPTFVPFALALLAVICFTYLGREKIKTFFAEFKQRDGFRAKTLHLCHGIDGVLTFVFLIFHSSGEGGVPAHGELRETGRNVNAALVAASVTTVEISADTPSVLKLQNESCDGHEHGHSHSVGIFSWIAKRCFALADFRPSQLKRPKFSLSKAARIALYAVCVISAGVWSATSATEFADVIMWAGPAVMVVILLSGILTEGSVILDMSSTSYQLAFNTDQYLKASVIERNDAPAVRVQPEGESDATGKQRGQHNAHAVS
jgi:hypothetical protein